MNKIIILILMFIVSINLVNAVCCEANENCTVIETCTDGNCGSCYMQLYNITGNLNQSGDMGKVTAYTYHYNLTMPLDTYGSWPYTINCTTGDSCIAGNCAIEVKQMCEEINMEPIGMIIFIPIALAFFYLAISWLLRGKAHWALSIGLVLMAFIEFFRAYSYGIMAIAKYYNWPEMQNVIAEVGIQNYGIMYGVVIMYFIIHMIIVLSMGQWVKNKKKIGDYGDYEW